MNVLLDSRNPSHEVPAIVLPTLRRFAVREGLSPELIREVGLGEGAPRKMRWDEFAATFEALSRLRPATPRRFAEHYVTEFPPALSLAAYVMSTRMMYRVAWFVWARLWPMLGIRFQVGRCLALDMKLSEGLVPCEPFFQFVHHLLANVPRLVHQPAMEVRGVAGPRGGSWEIELPGSGRSKPADDGDPAEVISHARSELFGESFQLGPEIPGAWGLTPAEARVVQLLVEGRSLREIGGALAIGHETVRTHVKRAMSKAGVRRQAELVSRALRRA